MLLALLAPILMAQPDELVGHGVVRSDGTLRVKQWLIRLHGIYIPTTERQCRASVRPVRCDDRAVLALDSKVRGFLHCYPQYDNDDGTIAATCYVDRTPFRSGEDLAAYLIRKGWALALPDAPFEYHAMERIAEKESVGVWGRRVDVIESPRTRRH